MRKAMLWRSAGGNELGCEEEYNEVASNSAVLPQSGSQSVDAREADHEVHCLLCRQFCRLLPDTWGRCGVRLNKDGALYTVVDDQVAAINLDPVEKKPLYHFLPGTMTYSLGTQGCNMHCQFCQNHGLAHSIKQSRVLRGQYTNPAILVNNAKTAGAASISYTYSEPTIFFELMLPTAKLAVDQGLKNIMVSNGYQSRQCLKALANVIHGVNFDLKAFSDSFYKRLCNAQLSSVLDTLREAVNLGWWVEVTTLLIPGENDSPDELQRLAEFICSDLGRHVPWHISRYRPAYQLKNPVTPLETLDMAARIGKEAGLDYVYIGNAPNSEWSDTCCASCGAVVIARQGYHIQIQGQGLVCPSCDVKIAGVAA
jgi:pyruvate formate lyase activating enzyme